MKVGVASADWSKSMYVDQHTPAMGGSGWIRLGQYIPHVTFDPIMGILLWDKKDRVFGVRSWDGVYHYDIDILVMQRWMDYRIADQVTEARKNGQVIINDVDDWYWGLDPNNRAFKVLHPKVNPESNINHYRSIIRNSDIVSVSTEFLADKISQWNPNIFLIKNHVELDKFTPRVHEETDKPTLGWIGSTAHRSGDLEILRGWLSQVSDKYGFHHTGHVDDKGFPPLSKKLGLPDELVSRTPFLTSAEFANGFTFDIGMVPLTMKDFNEAKSWIKGLEYAAAGIPFVASPSGEYRKFKEQYGVGRLAKRGRDWLKHFDQLRDHRVRAEEAAANLEAVQSLDVRYGALLWDQLIESAG